MQKFQSYTRILASGAPAPGATVTVYNAGTLVLATIYSDNLSTPKANPFTADSNGYIFFYAADGRYDVVISGTGIATPYTWGDNLLDNPAALPLSQAGDLLGYSTLPVRIPLGTDGQILTVDNVQAAKVKWASLAASGWSDAGTTISPTTSTDTVALAAANELTVPGGGAASERLGAGAVATGIRTVALGNQASATAPDAVVIGCLASAPPGGQPGKIAIGQGATATHGSIVLGPSADTADGQFVVGGGSLVITDIWIGLSPFGTTPGATVPVTYHGIECSNGDGASDGHICIAGGRGKGTGAAGHVKLQTAFPTSSGSNPQTLIDRHIVNARPKVLVHATATGILSIALPTGTYAGGRLTVTVNATAGGDFQTLTFTFTFAAINKTGTFTVDLDVASSSSACSNGTLTAVASWDTSVANTATLKILATSAGIGVPTTLEAIWQGEFNSRQVTTVL